MREAEFDLISKEFKKIKPKYKLLVDVGASGFYSSASLLVKEGGWGGILFEPDPRSYNILVKAYKKRPDVKVLNKAVSNNEGKLTFLLHPDVALSALEPNVTWYKVDTKVEKIQIKVVHLQDELKKLKVPLDFDLLKIDAEGFDYRILEDFLSSNTYRPYLIMHEIQSPGPEGFEKLLKKHKYELIYNHRTIYGPASGGNMLYRRA